MSLKNIYIYIYDIRLCFSVSASQSSLVRSYRASRTPADLTQTNNRGYCDSFQAKLYAYAAHGHTAVNIKKAVETFTPPAARRRRKNPADAPGERECSNRCDAPMCALFSSRCWKSCSVSHRGSSTSQKRCFYAFGHSGAGRVGGGAAVWMLRGQPSRSSVKHLASREAHKIKLSASCGVGGEGAAQRWRVAEERRKKAKPVP